MRTGLLAVVSVVVVTGCADTQPPVGDTGADIVWARTADGLMLDAQCADPGFCGCDYTGYDLDASGSDETCVHATAVVAGTLGVGARVEAGAEVAANATLGAGATLGANSLLAERATVGAGAIIGAGVTIARRASIGDDAQIGDGSTIGRSAVVEEDVDASVGQLTLGYGARLGARTQVTGLYTVLGNLTAIGADSLIGGGVVVARSSTFGIFTILGEGAIIGPEVTGLDHVTIGNNVRVRKQCSFEDDTSVGAGSRIGRGTQMWEGSSVGVNATLRALVTVDTYARVEDGEYIPRGTFVTGADGGPGSDPFVADAPPVVTITSPGDGADSASGSLTITGTVTDDLGVASVQIRVDASTWQTVTLSGSNFSFGLTGIPDMSTTVEVRAFDTSGQLGVDRIYLSDSSSTPTVTHVWTGAVSADWSNGANWDTGTVPGTSHEAYIPGSVARQPVLSATVAVGTTFLDYDAVIDTGSFQLIPYAAHYGGTVVGEGGIRTYSARMNGRVSNLDVEGSTYVDGYLHVLGDVVILPGTGRLRVEDATVQIDGNYTQEITTASNGVYFDHPDAVVIVEGDASFGGTAVQGASQFLQGRMIFRGDVDVICTGVACLRGGETVMEFDGTTPQTLYINAAAADGGSTTESFLGSVTVRNNAGVTITTPSPSVYSGGQLQVLNGGKLLVDSIEFGADSVTTVISGNATFDASGNVVFRGDVDVRDASLIEASTFAFDQALTMSPESGLTANLVTMDSDLPRTSDHYDATITKLVGVALIDNETVDMTMPHFAITDGGRLRVLDATVRLTGEYSQDLISSVRGLYLEEATSRFELTGNATFEGSSVQGTGNMDSGVMTLTGDLIVACDPGVNCFQGGGTRMIFNGTTPQNITVPNSTSSTSRFHTLEVAAGADVHFTTDVYTSSDVTVFGTLTNPSGFTATANRDLFVNGGVLVNAGSFLYNRNYTLFNGGTLQSGSNTPVNY